MAKGTKYSQEFKEDAVRYRLEHSDIALRKCAENLGISESALVRMKLKSNGILTIFFQNRDNLSRTRMTYQKIIKVLGLPDGSVR